MGLEGEERGGVEVFWDAQWGVGYGHFCCLAGGSVVWKSVVSKNAMPCHFSSSSCHILNPCAALSHC